MTERNHNKLPRWTEQTGTQARITRPSTGKCCHKRRKAVTSTAPGRDLVGIHQMSPLEHTSDKQTYYSFIDPGRMKGWVGLVGWPVADGLPHNGHPSAAGRAQDKSTPFRGPMPKPHYLPNPWTRPTYDAKRHSDPFLRFSTMHWTDRQTDRRNGPTDHPLENLITIGMGDRQTTGWAKKPDCF